MGGGPSLSPYGGGPSLFPYGWRTISLLTDGGPSLSLWVEGHLSSLGGGPCELAQHQMWHRNALTAQFHQMMLES